MVPGEDAEQERLAALASLQTRMIRRAMEFPGLRRFTYSTCSVHNEENEHVVIAALESDEAKHGGWRLAERARVLPTWPHRGRPEACRAEAAECMVRCPPGGIVECAPGEVHTEASIGFFVCCFERGAPDAGASRKRMKKRKKQRTDSGPPGAVKQIKEH